MMHSIDLATSNSAQNRSILRIVVIAILIALLWKVRYFAMMDHLHEAIPLDDADFFPWWFRQQFVARWSYLAACTLAAVLVVAKRRSLLIGLSTALLVLVATLNIHQSGYNDVTFLCCGWAAAWCIWFSSRINEPASSLHPKAAWLAHAILSLIFLGGAVGKMTDEYWSGQVLFDIYFEKRDYWFYNVIRNAFDASTVRDIATWHSRVVAVSEFICAFLWLMPMRFASWLAIVMLLGIALTNNVLLFSVVTSLIGLAIVGLHPSPTEHPT